MQKSCVKLKNAPIGLQGSVKFTSGKIVFSCCDDHSWTAVTSTNYVRNFPF